MLRKTMLAVIAIAAIGLGTTADVSARGGGGHGGGHGGGFGGGGFRGGGFRGGGIGYGGYYGYGYGYPFAYGSYYDDEEGGLLLVLTPTNHN